MTPVSVRRGARGDGGDGVSVPAAVEVSPSAEAVAYATDPKRHLSVLFRPGWRLTPKIAGMSDGPEHAREITSPGRPRTVEVADGVYAYVQPDGTWWINNTGFVVGPQGVFSIDACSTERRTRAYLAAIGNVTAAPVRTLVNTHHHGDHTFGNALFPTATIVAHERARAEAIALRRPARDQPFWENPDWGQLPLEPPFLTFTDEIALHAGDTRISVQHVGTAAHTTNDVLAWLPRQSVLFCGDLVFNGGTPFLLMGSVAGCVEVLERVVLALGARTVVPGHGRYSRAPPRSRPPSTTWASSSSWPPRAARRA